MKLQILILFLSLFSSTSWADESPFKGIDRVNFEVTTITLPESIKESDNKIINSLIGNLDLVFELSQYDFPCDKEKVYKRWGVRGELFKKRFSQKALPKNLKFSVTKNDLDKTFESDIKYNISLQHFHLNLHFLELDRTIQLSESNPFKESCGEELGSYKIDVPLFLNSTNGTITAQDESIGSKITLKYKIIRKK